MEEMVKKTCQECFFGNVESKTVSSMNLAACILKPCWSICLERGRRWLWTGQAKLRQTREESLRAMRGSGRSTIKGKMLKLS